MNRGSYILVEGPDGVGKTTLANYFRDRYGLTLTHCGPPETDAMGFYLDRLRAVTGGGVFDRLHAGSYVYGTAFRNGPDLTLQEEWLLEGYMMANGAVLIYCSVPAEVVDENLAGGPDNEDAEIYEAESKRALVRDLYREYADRTNLSVCYYDYTQMDVKLLASNVMGRLSAALVVAPKFTAAILGNTGTPRYVFVGDRPNGYDRVVNRDRRGHHDGRLLRRMSFKLEDGTCWGSGSGRYLFQTLRAADLRLQDYCTFNSVQWDGRTVADLVAEDPGWFAEIQGHENNAEFVALGNLASGQLTSAGIPHRKVPHPQHWRRFHYKAVLDYGRMLTGEQRWEGCKHG